MAINEQLTTSLDTPIDWGNIWPDVAEQVATDDLGLRFLAEHDIRRFTVRSLAAHSGVDTERDVEIEYPAINLHRAHDMQRSLLDMVVYPRTAATVLEFKYPREPRQTLPPWPDHLGNFLSDTYRLAELAADEDKIHQGLQVVASGEKFLRYMQRTSDRLGLAQYHDGEMTPHTITLNPEQTTGLAGTTLGKLKGRDKAWEVFASRTSDELEIAGKGLWLAVYDVRGRRRMPAA